MRVSEIEHIVLRAETLIESGQYGQVLEVTNKALQSGGQLEPKLWRLSAVASGNLGDHWYACQCLWRSLCLRFDETTLANYITSLFALGYYERATWLLENCYNKVGGRARSVLIKTIVEAIWIKAIQVEDLPKEAIQDILDQRS